VPMEGGTTFHFVTDGVESAVDQAKAAADGKSVEIAGGASTVNACLRAGLVDELHLHISPVLLGAGERLFDGVPDTLRLEPVQVVSSPGVTHVKYRVG
jgi:dihydrofolate reductase